MLQFTGLSSLRRGSWTNLHAYNTTIASCRLRCEAVIGGDRAAIVDRDPRDDDALAGLPRVERAGIEPATSSLQS
jgi:hypothetical protein